MMKRCVPMVLGVVAGLYALGAAAADGGELYAAKCAGCHGADGAKAAMGVGRPIKGQTAAQLEKELKGYQDGTYGGPKKTLMERLVKDMSAEELKALAEYIAKL